MPLRAQLWPALTNLVARRGAELDGSCGYLPVTRGRADPDRADSAAAPRRAGATLEYGIADFSLALMAQSAAPGEARSASRSAR